MTLVGINTTCTSNAMSLAFKVANIKLATKKPQWPRKKGPSAVKIDTLTGYAVAYLETKKGKKVN